MLSTVESMKSRLDQESYSVVIRGTGCAEFLFVEYGGRAVEISKSSGSWWIEFWDISDDENASPTKEESLDSDESAIFAIKKWFRPLT